MSEQYPGGFITKSPPTPQGNNANSSAYGIWNLSQQAGYQAQGLWPDPTKSVDPQFNYVTMLLHGDGTNGAQNNTFLDSSSNALTVSNGGSPAQGSFSPYGSNWSNNFPSTGMYLTVGSNLSLGYSDYTIEFWFAGSTFELTWGTPGGYAPIAINSAGALYFANSSNTGWQAYISLIITDGSWNHYAIVRQSGSFKVFRNGVLLGTPAGPSGNTDNGSVVIGSYGTGSVGYVSNFRAVIGSAVYTSAFTPSTVPLTAITNTALLTCQSNRFVDNSPNAYSITPTGTPSVQRFNPFGESVAYSASTVGGSAYFSATSGQYLSVANNAAFTLGDTFTVECWIYKPTSGDGTILGRWYAADASSWLLHCYSGNFAFGLGTGSYVNGTSPMPIGQWAHLAVSNDTTSKRLYLNGVLVNTYSSDNVSSLGSLSFYVNQNNGGGSGQVCYVSDVRIVKGTALYSGSSFTLPTTPLSAVSGTSFLLNTQNGAIYDNSEMNDLVTVGNAQISTSVVKYGTGSMAFDGSGDYLILSNKANVFFGTGDFTVEAWINPTAITNDFDAIFSISGTSGDWNAQGNGMVLCVRKLAITGTGTSGLAYSTNPATGVWSHLAVARSSGVVKVFLNGAVVLTNSNSDTLGGTTDGFPTVGIFDAGSRFPFNGYIDDLRITKGYARYTTTFTPPTAAFPNIGPN